jgi:hypothetical protein
MDRTGAASCCSQLEILNGLSGILLEIRLPPEAQPVAWLRLATSRRSTMDVLVAFVLGARPRVTETATGYVVTVPHGRRAFIISPGTEAPSLKGQAAVGRALLRAKVEDATWLSRGTWEVRVSGRAWDSDALVQTLATYMAAPGGIVAIIPAHRALAARLWACMVTMGRRLLHRDERLVVRPVQQAAGTRQVSQAASAAKGVSQDLETGPP